MSDERKSMTDEELAEINGRLAAITEWPWIVFCRTGVGHRMGITNKRLFDDDDAPEVLDVVELGEDAGGIKSEADAAFIAAAPTDISRLLAEVERLRSEVTRLNKEADWLVKMLSHYTEDCPLKFKVVYEVWFPIPRIDQCSGQESDIEDCAYIPSQCWREAARKAVEEEERHG